MNTNEKYTQFALCREMMETPKIIKNFKIKDIDKVVDAVKSAGKIFFTGEGSSRIFPAKNAMYTAMKAGLKLNLATEGGRQSAEYDLSDFVVFGASNSGSTKEVIALLDKLQKAGHRNRFSLTAREGTKLSTLTEQTFVLSCGWEEAVAATKSVAEQALFYQELLAKVEGNSVAGNLSGAADAFADALTLKVDHAITAAIAGAGTIYFAGRNDGVAEELTLKTNEITHKKSDFLEGTYAVHGIEEVMNANDVVILINPFKDELEKIRETLVDGVGLKVFAISSEETIFSTIRVKDAGDLRNYVYLAAGWNILVEVGVHLGINLDKAQRARKVGNEFIG